MTAVATSSTSAAAAANGDHLPTVQESPEEAGNAAAAAAVPATSAQLPSAAAAAAAALPVIAGLPSKRSGSTPGETRKRRSKGGRRSLAGSPLPKRTKSGEFMASANADRAAPPSVNPYFYYPEPRASTVVASKRGSFRGGWHHHQHQQQQPLPDTVLPFNPQDARLIADMHENDDIEEIVKCVCTVREENGLMVQCEVSGREL